jgi:hypothetical protein
MYYRLTIIFLLIGLWGAQTQNVRAANLMPDDFKTISSDPLISSCLRQSNGELSSTTLAQLIQLENGSEKGWKTITLPLTGKNNFKITVPYSAKWKVADKQVLPFTRQNDEYAVGAITLLDYSVQDIVCALGRRYSINIQKKTLKQLDKELRQIYSSGEGWASTEKLPTIYLTIANKKAALIPTLTVSSGGSIMVYDALAVEIKGHTVLIRDPQVYHAANIDSAMLRMAASIN